MQVKTTTTTIKRKNLKIFALQERIRKIWRQLYNCS